MALKIVTIGAAGVAFVCACAYLAALLVHFAVMQSAIPTG